MRVISDGALCNYEIWDQRKGKLNSSRDGSPSAFVDWDLNVLLHTKNNCYPNPSYDFQGFHRRYQSGEDIRKHLIAVDASQCAEDIFMCHRSDLENLHFMHKVPGGITLQWKRLCLRKNTNPITHILGLAKIESLEAAFIDSLPLQKIVDNHIEDKSNERVLAFQQALIDKNFEEQAQL